MTRKAGTEAAIELVKEALHGNEWVSLAELVETVNKKHYKEWTTRSLGMILRGAVKRNEIQRRRMCDAGVRSALLRLTPCIVEREA